MSAAWTRPATADAQAALSRRTALEASLLASLRASRRALRLDGSPSLRVVWSSDLQRERQRTLRRVPSVSQCLRLACLDLGATTAAASRTQKDQTAKESEG